MSVRVVTTYLHKGTVHAHPVLQNKGGIIVRVPEWAKNCSLCKK